MERFDYEGVVTPTVRRQIVKQASQQRFQCCSREESLNLRYYEAPPVDAERVDAAGAYIRNHERF